VKQAVRFGNHARLDAVADAAELRSQPERFHSNRPLPAGSTRSHQLPQSRRAKSTNFFKDTKILDAELLAQKGDNSRHTSAA